jgi:hypothetical protein
VIARSIEDVCEAIWEVERKLDLLDWELRGILVWQGLRFETYLRLCRALGIFDMGPAGDGAGLGSRLARAAARLRGCLTHNPFFGSATFDALVFEHVQTKLVDGRGICIHTDDLAAELAARGERVMLLDRADRGRHRKAPDPRRMYLDAIELASAVCRRTGRISLSTAEADVVTALERSLHARLGASVPLRARLEGYVPWFRTEHALFRRLLTKRTPARVYCVCAYGGLAPLIKAARDMGVQSIELQHGTMSRYHLGYSFPVRPRRQRLEYFPDLFYSWGEPWQSLIELPIDRERVVARGFPYFERQRSRYQHVARRERDVLVLSQGAIGRQLADVLFAAIDAFDGRHIYYKLHPSEYAGWRERESLLRLAQRPNVQVIADGDLYELMARCGTQIGVFSTAIYEGLEFGCRTVLVDLPGIEYMRDLIATGRTEPFADFVARLRAERGTFPPPDV